MYPKFLRGENINNKNSVWKIWIRIPSLKKLRKFPYIFFSLYSSLQEEKYSVNVFFFSSLQEHKYYINITFSILPCRRRNIPWILTMHWTQWRGPCEILPFNGDRTRLIGNTGPDVFLVKRTVFHNPVPFSGSFRNRW